MSLSILTGSLIYDIFIFFATIYLYFYLKFKFHSRYEWKRLNIPFLEPTFLFGNTLKALFFESFWEITTRYYKENRDKPILGIWIYTIPALLVQDVNLVKAMLVKDFDHFHDRGFIYNGENDPLGEHLIILSGTKWRKLRAKLTPVFTSGKLKKMFPLILECGKELEEVLKDPGEKEEIVEWKSVLSRFTIDVIASCAFGIKTNSQKNPGEDFEKYGTKAAYPDIFYMIYYWIISNSNFLKKILPFPWRPKGVTDFFLNSVRETVEYREKYHIKRNDFMDLIIQLKNNGKLDDADNNSEDASETEITFETVASQAYVFFLAGFASSSKIMALTLYELARNPDAQKKLQIEIDRVLAKYDSKITYEAVQEMEYLDCVINEVLRFYPPVPILSRTCTKDYTFPGTDIKIKKGTGTLIQVMGIHSDPQYFPDPEKFDPERFTEEEKLKRNKFLHIPWGEGPRTCIGMRFSLAMMKTGLIIILSKYNVDISEKTEIPVKMDPRSLTMSIYKNVNLKITRRKS